MAVVVAEASEDTTDMAVAEQRGTEESMPLADMPVKDTLEVALEVEAAQGLAVHGPKTPIRTNKHWNSSQGP